MMSSRTIFALAVLLVVSAAHAAHAETHGEATRAVHAGAKLGPSLVRWGGADASEASLATGGKLGYALAAFAKLGLSERLSLDTGPLGLAVQPELAYAAKGAGIEIGMATGSYDLAYLSVAVLPRAEYDLGALSPYLVVGPELGFLLSAEIVNSQGDVTSIEDDFTSTDLGMVLGLGVDVPLSSHGALVVELRADLGLVSIDGQGDGDDIKNQAFSAMLGYQY